MSDEKITKANGMRAPSSVTTAPSLIDRLAGTTGEDSTAANFLPINSFATVKNGAQAIRITFSGTAGLSNQVASTDLLLEANGRFDWFVEKDTAVVYVQSSDGSTAYECWVWASSV